MEVVVISSPDRYKSEVEVVIELFKLGLQTFHVRKPKFSIRKLKGYLSLFPSEYHDRIVIHSHHLLAKKFSLKGVHLTRKHKKKTIKTWLSLKYLTFFNPELFITSSCHNLYNLLEHEYPYNYVFLSPVFDSISKEGHRSGYSETEIKNVLKKTKYRVYALGGVDESKIEKIEELSFNGVALLGALWNTEDCPVELFKSILKRKNHQSDIKINPIRIQI